MQILKVANASFKTKLQYNNNLKEEKNLSFKKIGMDELNSNPIANLNKVSISFCANKKNEKFDNQQKINEEEIKTLLLENGWSEENGQYKYKLSRCDFEKISSKFLDKKSEDEDDFSTLPSYGFVIKNITKPLIKKDIENMAEILNICDDKYVGYVKENLKRFVVLYQFLAGGREVGISYYTHNIDPEMTKDKWEFILDSLDNMANKSPTEEQLYAIEYYKFQGYKIINKYCRILNQNSEAEIPDEIKKEIQDIRDYIDTQEVKKPVNVYRSSDYYEYSDIKTISGKTLSELMEIANSLSDKEINAICEKIKKYHNKTTYKNFLSTSLLQDRAGNSKDNIKYEFTILPGSKALFVEGLSFGSEMRETEVLLKDNSKIEVTDIKYDKNSNKWLIKALVRN